MKLITKSTIATSLLAVFAVMATPAHAVIVSGNANTCVASNGSQSGDFVRTALGIQNISGGSRWVTCPMPKWTFAMVNAPSVIVGATNTGAANQLQCTFSSVSAQTVMASATTAFPVGYSGQAISTTPGGQFWSTYSLECLLPPSSSLNSVYFNGL
jgi:hypothetical protein